MSPRMERIGDATIFPKGLVRIYALCEYPSWRPRYVGKTTGWMGARHKQHIIIAKRPGLPRLPVHRWLRKQIDSGRALVIRLLEYVEPGNDWVAREKAWIKKLRDEYPDLLNLTDGGEGLAGHIPSAEHRSAISKALRTGAFFECLTCGSQFWRKQTAIKLGNNKFCSRHCYSRSLLGLSREIPAETMRRGIVAAAAAKRARTICPSGHPFAASNVRLNRRGARVCLACERASRLRYLAKVPEGQYGFL